MATFTVNPTYPIPNREVKVIVNASVTNTNFFRVWVTVAPTNSALDNNIKSTTDPRNRFKVYEGSGGVNFPFIAEYTKGGKYTFVVQEYIKGSGYGGAFEGDPNGSDSEALNGSEYTLYVYIGQRLTQIIGPQDNQASINLWVWDNTIRQTYKSIHGEDTPSITAETPTNLVKAAIESDTVATALANLINTNPSTVIGDLSFYALHYVYGWNIHTSTAIIHSSSDVINELNNSLLTAYTPSTLKDLVNAGIAAQTAHFSNDNSLDKTLTPTDPIGPGAADWHTIPDKNDLPVYTSVGSFAEAYGGLVDLYRTFLNHAANTDAHTAEDSTAIGDSPDLSLLMKVHKEFLSIIADTNPSPPLAQSTAAQILISGAGFKE